jgi:hypothetical protein
LYHHVGAAATIKVSVLLSQKRRAHFSIFAPHPSIPQSAAMSLAARSARTHIIINSTLFFTYNSLLLYAKQLLADTRQSNMYTSESRGAELFQALASVAPLLLFCFSLLSDELLLLKYYFIGARKWLEFLISLSFPAFHLRHCCVYIKFHYGSFSKGRFSLFFMFEHKGCDSKVSRPLCDFWMMKI